MKIKKLTALIIIFSMFFAFAGCDKTAKSRSQIEKVIEEYSEALSDFDSDAVLDLTAWDDSDEEYGLVELRLDYDYYKEGYTKTGADIYKYIMSTVKIDYKSEDIDIKDNKATVKIKYRLVDWESVLGGTYPDYDYLLKQIKKCKDTTTVKDKLTFELVDGEWKITKIQNFEDLFRFIYSLPYNSSDPVIVNPTEPDPTGTEPTESDPTGIIPIETTTEAFYREAIDSYLWTLGQEKDAIKRTEELFHVDSVGVYDINLDGVPELYYLTEDRRDFSAKMCICDYNEYAGETITEIEIPGIMYMAADGGYYLIFATNSEIIICCSGGEADSWHVETDVYDLKWQLKDHYVRNEIYDFDKESYTYEYYRGNKKISANDYISAIGDLVDRTEIILASNYTPSSNEPEYALVYKPEMYLMSYDDAVDYLNYLKK